MEKLTRDVDLQKNRIMTQGYGKSIKLKIISFVKLELMIQILANQKLIAAVLNILVCLMIPHAKLIHFKTVLIIGMIHL